MRLNRNSMSKQCFVVFMGSDVLGVAPEILSVHETESEAQGMLPVYTSHGWKGLRLRTAPVQMNVAYGALEIDRRKHTKTEEK